MRLALRESLGVTPPRALHRRFAATGRTAPLPSAVSPHEGYMVVVSSGGNTSTGTSSYTTTVASTAFGVTANVGATIAVGAGAGTAIASAAMGMLYLGQIQPNVFPVQAVRPLGMQVLYGAPIQINVGLSQPAAGPFLNTLVAGWDQGGHAAASPPKREVQQGRLEDFLQQVYALARLNDIQGATDLIFSYLDRLLCNGLFYICDDILKRVEIEKLPTTLMRSILSITAPAKDKLPSRRALYERIERRMVELKGQQTTARLLGRLL